MNDRKTVGGKHVSRSRMVSYSYSFDPEEAELAKIDARLTLSRVVIEFGIGARTLWFNGMPGAAMRSVVSDIEIFMTDWERV